MKIFIRTFGWPYIPVRRDNFGVVEEDKWFGVRGLKVYFTLRQISKTVKIFVELN